MISDRPRRIQKKEIAAEIGIHPSTLSHYLAGGLSLPVWPCTMGECVRAFRIWREALTEAERLKIAESIIAAK